ncbi:exonuclease SbcCD subunit D C-terminal domain-containing protein [Sporolactobacillus sp. STSJ-5]|uniref:exonuclease SbcCD subunit D n=1 Tax=Sporolactobacillus sp. STSJ-5 TaxID=2965076 RepID=UPI0021037472|nr:exonuclease SbcCD subunit D [Sporolactobacillus sp. STSJ-5]MCQ2009425.1 exonuclease SbcCD subunit D C-terminal domain-containing protein [Sporolactobacillus sp. STSJ-5]
MKLLHTADWHLGRSLEGRSRAEEQEQVMDEICCIADEENVDAILMAGDVFDTVNPPAASEALFYETAQRLSLGGKRPVLIIAGNHDSPERLEASRPLAGRQGITIVGRPVLKPLVIPIKRTDETLVLGCVPYPSESRLNECLSEINDEDMIKAAYNERLAALFREQAKSFNKDAVNILMTHLFAAGGKESDSERPIQVGGAYTVHPSAFPRSAQYVALGHLHRPQNLLDSPVPARYAGSPLAYSFSEAGRPKSISILEGMPGAPLALREIELKSGRPLTRWHAENGLNEVHQWIDEARDPEAWIDLEIRLDEAMSMHDIQALRKARPRIVTIRPIYNSVEEDKERSERSNLPIDELFVRFYKKQTDGAEPGTDLIRLFMQLIDEDEAAREVAAGRVPNETD